MSEVFMLGPFLYPIAAALRVIEESEREPQPVSVYRAAVNAGILTLAGAWVEPPPGNVDRERAMEVDLTKPIIVMQLDRATMVIADGRHRLVKACVLGVRELPGYLLTAEEAESIKCLIAVEEG
ncbi:ParB N-terminal domain-containing protein [Longispora fulva]|nr:ParB N-terminal domain-containing protein [Longispora fulva]